MGWASIDGLSDADFYEIASPNGSRGTNDVGNVHVQMWVTVESQAVASGFRFMYSTEDATTPYGMTLMTLGTNGTLVLHSRGPVFDHSNEYALPPELIGVPIQVVGVINGMLLQLYVNGAKPVVDQALPSAGRYAIPVDDICIGKRPNGTGNSVTGDIKVHGWSSGNTVPTPQEIYDAYAAGAANEDIRAIGSAGVTEHMYSARLQGSAAATFTDRVGSQNYTRVGTPTYVAGTVTMNGDATVLEPFGAGGTLTITVAGSGAGVMDALVADGSSFPDTTATGAGVLEAAVASGSGVVGVAGAAPITVYTPLGTTFIGESGETITDTGKQVQKTVFTRSKLMLGFIRTDDARGYPIIGQQGVSAVGAASLSAPIAAGVGSSSITATGDASFPELVPAGILVNTTIGLSGAANLSTMTGAGALAIGGAASGVLEPFAVGSHWNEYTKYAAIKAAGITHIRIDAPWNEIEASQGTLNWAIIETAVAEATRVGLKMLMILGYTPTWASSGSALANPQYYAHRQVNEGAWQTYISAAVSRFGDRVAAWEVWNEPDHDNFLKLAGGTYAENTFPGETAVNRKRIQYQRMVDLAMPFLTGKVVTTSGFSQGGSWDTGFVDWLKLRNSGTWLNQFNVANYHGYGYTSYDRLVTQPAFWNSIGSQIGKTWEHWITEHGITTTGVSDADVKRYLVRSYAMALAQANVTKLFWFRAGYDPNHMDLFDAASNTTAAYAAMLTLSGKWSQPTAFTGWASGTARGTIATRFGATSMAIVWADSGGAALNSYGFDLLNAYNQDGTSVGLGTTLTSYPVFLEINDLLPVGTLITDRAVNYMLDRAGNYVAAR